MIIFTLCRSHLNGWFLSDTKDKNLHVVKGLYESRELLRVCASLSCGNQVQFQFPVRRGCDRESLPLKWVCII